MDADDAAADAVANAGNATTMPLDYAARCYAAPLLQDATAYCHKAPLRHE